MRLAAILFGLGLAVASHGGAMAFNDTTVRTEPGGTAAGGIRDNQIDQTINQRDPALLAATTKVLSDQNAATTGAQDYYISAHRANREQALAFIS